MGFKVNRTVFVLKFGDPELLGLRVVAKKPSMGEQLDTINLLDLANLSLPTMKAEDGERIKEGFRFFGRFLVEWNLEEEDGTPVPCTPDGLLGLEDGLATSIVDAWVQAVSSVPKDLKEKSNVGLRSVVESIPTEPLSASLADSLGQS